MKIIDTPPMIKSVMYEDKTLKRTNTIDGEILDQYSEFSIGSITKVFTSVCILMLQQEKKINVDWYRLKTTKSLIEELGRDLISDTGIPVSGLVHVRKGGNPLSQGSWIHPDLAIQLAQWVSPSFLKFEFSFIY